MPPAEPASLTDDELADLPVFPLPNVVLFPGTQLPLHLFEPRYRNMIEDIVAADRTALAVAGLCPGWEDDYEGRPATFDTAGVGRITAHRRNADGTHDIVLAAIDRVRLTELEPHPRGYRRARAFVLRERPPRGDTAATTALLSAARDLAATLTRRDPGFRLPDTDADPGRLADRLADRLIPDPALRQDLLETLDVELRMRAVSAELLRLRDLLAGRAPRVLH